MFTKYKVNLPGLHNKSEQKLKSTSVVHAMVLKKNTYYRNMNTTINIVTQLSNNLKR